MVPEIGLLSENWALTFVLVIGIHFYVIGVRRNVSEFRREADLVWSAVRRHILSDGTKLLGYLRNAP